MATAETVRKKAAASKLFGERLEQDIHLSLLWEKKQLLENDLMHIDPSPNIEGEDDMTDKPGLQNFNTKPILLGADVEALYPNMERTATGGMIYQAVLESDVSFQGINYELLAIYLFLVMGRNLMYKAGLEDCIPRRRFDKSKARSLGAKINRDFNK